MNQMSILLWVVVGVAALIYVLKLLETHTKEIEEELEDIT